MFLLNYLRDCLLFGLLIILGIGCEKKHCRIERGIDIAAKTTESKKKKLSLLYCKNFEEFCEEVLLIDKELWLCKILDKKKHKDFVFKKFGKKEGKKLIETYKHKALEQAKNRVLIDNSDQYKKN